MFSPENACQIWFQAHKTSWTKHYHSGPSSFWISDGCCAGEDAAKIPITSINISLLLILLPVCFTLIFSISQIMLYVKTNKMFLSLILLLKSVFRISLKYYNWLIWIDFITFIDYIFHCTTVHSRRWWWTGISLHSIQYSALSSLTLL